MTQDNTSSVLGRGLHVTEGIEYWLAVVNAVVKLGVP